ncbi:MAG: Bacterial Ig-like domain (group 2) [Pelotomaculum sp. PtaU1.Bin035]|nr:MAG: Bacterial Ig-like domain (group 2) [Pelotomaculum sp. PtaU1.Bin035]
MKKFIMLLALVLIMICNVAYADITGISLSQSVLNLDIDDIVEIGVYEQPGGAACSNFVVENTNENIVEAVKVGGNGIRITALNVGNASITAVSGGGYRATCNIVVNPIRVTGVDILQEELNLEAGEIIQLEYSVNPTNATNKAVKFTSTNTDICLVDSTGKVRPISANSTAQIVIETVDGGYQDTCWIFTSSYQYQMATPPAGMNQVAISWMSQEVINDIVQRIYEKILPDIARIPDDIKKKINPELGIGLIVGGLLSLVFWNVVKSMD